MSSYRALRPSSAFQRLYLLLPNILIFSLPLVLLFKPPTAGLSSDVPCF
jgi:hypothetical protein